MNIFQNKIAVVTGAGSGIGRALSMALAEEGAVTVAAGINFKEVEEVENAIQAKGQKGKAYYVDVADNSEFEKLVNDVVRDYGRIDYLFNNAGVTLLGEVCDMELPHWNRLIDINLKGVAHGIHYVYPIMIEQGSGHIINIASVAGVTGYPSSTVYSATKSAVITLSDSLRYEAANHGVQISSVCPGYVNTRIFKSAAVLDASLEKILETIPFKFMEPAAAAQSILKGVRKRKGMIVFPAYAKLLCRIHRIFPFLSAPILKKLLTDFRAAHTEKEKIKETQVEVNKPV